eukprot:107609-Chlamydomonas_euryale.AAC.1
MICIKICAHDAAVAPACWTAAPAGIGCGAQPDVAVSAAVLIAEWAGHPGAAAAGAKAQVRHGAGKEQAQG